MIEKLKREQAAALRNQQYPSESCPVCMEDFQASSQDSRPSAPPLNPDMVSSRQFACRPLAETALEGCMTICFA